MSISAPPASDRDLVVRLNMDVAPGGMALLSPGGAMRWGRCLFDLNPPPGGRADFAVVLANARPYDRFVCAPQNTLFIAGEPLEKKLYAPGFYRQFGHVLDTHPMSRHPGLILGAPGLNWHVGLDMRSRTYRFGYDYLKALTRPPKENRIAVVCSSANFTQGQRHRLALLDYLKQRLGDRLVHFGRGFQPIDDKMDAILPYRYQLVLENTCAENYWTEKLADAYLGWAYPVYLGCPNLDAFFSPDAYCAIDGGDFAVAGDRIERLLERPESETEIAAVAESRHRVLDIYNPLAWAAHWAETLYRPAPESEVWIRIHKAFRPFPRGLIYRMRQALAG
ncbi:hypothetical protein CKCBHOJB_03397 [Thauera sp. GDN1]|uniref:glycosyltransferase family 10 domain-containing protein n=1 Tax=Thauera sp. GDN1 TaxID=2944810 RepID=UPI0024784908|nr:glycosyltransferase family 10 [Thauera sp. GDN1]WEN43767.1 hypothetical protein CKCBHOJB_03397 [Thauera sp. GDN1]